MNYLELIVTKEDAEHSLEDFLRKHKLSKKQISRAKFQSNGILKNGMACRTNAILQEGDFIKILLDKGSQENYHILPTSDGSLPDIIYEDRDLIVVNKPAGILTHPSGRHYQDTLSNQLVGYFQKKGEMHKIYPIGRLDKDSSGLLLFAKHQVAASRLHKQREEGLLHKEYLALAEGLLPNCKNQWHTINDPICKISDHPLKMGIAKADEYVGTVLPAQTHYQLLTQEQDSFGIRFSLCRIRIDTGRTHQIRVHMQAIGHPLLGDPLYGSQTHPMIKRAALHAYQLVFQQPLHGERIQLTGELPEDFQFFKKFYLSK